jgi:hypothetical protein
MRASACVVLPVLVTTSLIFAARGQAAESSNLTGIRTLGYLVESISSNECGIRAEDVETSLNFVLSQSRIRVVPSADSYVYVNVSVLEDCNAADVTVSVETPARIVANSRYTIVNVWHDGSLLTGRSEMRERVLSEVETLMKRLVVDWSSVNS